MIGTCQSILSSRLDKNSNDDCILIRWSRKRDEMGSWGMYHGEPFSVVINLFKGVDEEKEVKDRRDEAGRRREMGGQMNRLGCEVEAKE